MEIIALIIIIALAIALAPFVWPILGFIFALSVIYYVLVGIAEAIAIACDFCNFLIRIVKKPFVIIHKSIKEKPPRFTKEMKKEFKYEFNRKKRLQPMHW